MSTLQLIGLCFTLAPVLIIGGIALLSAWEYLGECLVEAGWDGRFVTLVMWVVPMFILGLCLLIFS